MYMLSEQEFDFGIFMKKRGWSTVISLMLFTILVLIILHNTRL